MRVLPISFFVIAFLLNACASMSPTQVGQTLPTLTKTKYLSRAEAEDLTADKACKYLTKDREYIAPMGLFPKDDLTNGATGIDEWVRIDGGNSYVLKSFKWVDVNQSGATQLILIFDTLKCD